MPVNLSIKTPRMTSSLGSGSAPGGTIVRFKES